MSHPEAGAMQRWPDPALPWPIPYEAVRAMAEEEQGPGGGVALRAYRCPAGVWTCGWGETEGVHSGTQWGKSFADARLCDSLTERAAAAQGMCTVTPSPNQLAALVRLSYNIGVGALARSSVLKAHNRADFAAAARAFALWNKARNPRTGQLEVMRGLVARRAAEAALYLRPEAIDAPSRMPQAVAPEPTLAASPTMGGGATLVTAGGTMAVLADAGTQVGQAKGTLDTFKAFALETLGIPPGWWLPGMLLAIGALVMYRRYRQRQQGVA